MRNECRDMTETAFHSWHSVTDWRDDDTWDDQNDDGETKTVLEFIRPQRPNLTMFMMMMMMMTIMK